MTLPSGIYSGGGCCYWKSLKITTNECVPNEREYKTTKHSQLLTLWEANWDSRKRKRQRERERVRCWSQVRTMYGSMQNKYNIVPCTRWLSLLWLNTILLFSSVLQSCCVRLFCFHWVVVLYATQFHFVDRLFTPFFSSDSYLWWIMSLFDKHFVGAKTEIKHEILNDLRKRARKATTCIFSVSFQFNFSHPLFAFFYFR